MVPTPATMKASRQEPSAAISPAMTMAPSAVPSVAPPVSRVAPRALSRRHPHGIELAAGGIDRALGDAEPETGEQQHRPVRRNRGDRLEEAPADGRQGDHDARLVPVGQHTARHLHEGIGPEERTQDQSLHRSIEVEFLADQRHGDRERGAIDVVDGNEHQHQKEDLPPDAGDGRDRSRIQHRRRCAHLTLPNERFIRRVRLMSPSAQRRSRSMRHMLALLCARPELPRRRARR